MKKFKTISREMLITSKYSPVEKQIVELPSGEQKEWYINQSNDAVIVVPFLKTGELLMQRTYKHGAGEIITEVCAGLVDDGETPEASAERELLEETGRAGNLEKIGEVYSNPTGSIMKYHFFIARDCEKVSEQELDEAEQIELFTVKDVAEAKKLLQKEGVYTSSATMAALSMIE